jgi:GNAT superfamily N-acetyltransferase
VIRPAQPGDVPTILALIRELATYEREPHAVIATEADLMAALFGEQPALFGLIAQHDDAATNDAANNDAAAADIAGFALWFLNFSTWGGRHGIYLEDLYVRAEFRGRGYGRDLLIELARIADERGYGRGGGVGSNLDETAHCFYESLGAVPMQDWTTWRLTDTVLAALAGRLRSRPDADGRAPDA